MKIIEHGNPKNEKREYSFWCRYCKCKWIADENEVTYVGEISYHCKEFIICNCPDCTRISVLQSSG